MADKCNDCNKCPTKYRERCAAEETNTCCWYEQEGNVEIRPPKALVNGLIVFGVLLIVALFIFKPSDNSSDFYYGYSPDWSVYNTTYPVGATAHLPFSVLSDGASRYGFLDITVVEVSRGADAYALLAEMSQGLEEAPEGYEYTLVSVRVTLSYKYPERIRGIKPWRDTNQIVNGSYTFGISDFSFTNPVPVLLPVAPGGNSAQSTITTVPTGQEITGTIQHEETARGYVAVLAPIGEVDILWIDVSGGSQQQIMSASFALD